VVFNYTKIFIYETVTDSVDTLPVQVNCVWRVLIKLWLRCSCFLLVSPDRS